MSNKITNKLFLITELFLFIGALIFIISNDMAPITAIGLLIIVVLIPLFFMFPYYSLLLLIIVRNATDTYTEGTFINFFDVINLNFSSILGILIIFWALYIFLKEKIDLKKIPLTIPWLLFMMFALFSFSYSVSKMDSLKMFLKLIDFYLIYTISYYYFTKYKTKKHYFIKAVFIAYLLPCILGIYQIVAKAGFIGPEQFNRIKGTYSHPNIFAFNLLLLFIIFIINYLQINNTEKKKKLLLFLVVIGILILYTLTRSAWIGLIILSVSLVLIYKRKYIVKSLLLIVSLLFIFIILTNYTPLKYFDWTDITFIKRGLTSNTFVSSWEWRLNTWSEMSTYVYQSPVIGFGLDTYRFLREKQIYSIYEDPYYAHNDYLKFLIELGVIGLLLYLNLLFQVLRKIYIKYIKSKNKKYLVSFIGIFVIFLIASVDNVLMSTSLQWVLWIFIAYLLTED
jgi:O-antigen ligase